jgi:hypothetical protein
MPGRINPPPIDSHDRAPRDGEPTDSLRRYLLISAHDRVDNLGELSAGFRQGIEIVFAGTSRLDETSMTQERKVVADSGLTLSAKVGAKLGYISLLFAQKHQYL